MRKFLSFMMAVLFAGSLMATNYELVTSTSDLEVGAKYVIGASYSSKFYVISTADNANNRKMVEATLTDGVVTGADDIMTFTLGGAADAWTFATDNYKGTAGYLNPTNTTSNNYLKVVAALDDYAKFTVTIADGVTTISCNGKTSRHIMYLNGTTCFACYNNQTGAQYVKPSLYKEVTATPPASTTKTLYCKMEYDWWTVDGAAIGAFAWKDGGETNADFPGIRMSPVVGDDYVWTIDIDTAKYDKIIFTRVNPSDADPSNYNWGAKTADLTIPKNDNNLYTITSTSAVWGDPGVTGAWSEYTPPTPPEDVTMYIVNKLGWTTLNAFVWPTTGSAPAAWPGEAMTKGSKALGYDVYSYTFPETYENIIFNDGTDQTADLVWAADKPYFVPGAKNAQNKYEGTWYASLEAIPIANCAEARAAALSVAANNAEYNGGASYTIRGYVTNIQTAWSNQKITFWIADDKEGGKILEAYQCAIANQDDAPNVGDLVEVTGKLTKYNTTPEFAAGCTCEIIERDLPPVNLGAKTITEFLALQDIKDTCVLTGVVTNITNTQYGNFDLVELGNPAVKVYVYGLLNAAKESKKFAELDVEANDTLTILAIYSVYNSNPQVSNAIFVSRSKGIAKYCIAGTMNSWTVGADEMIPGNGDSLSIKLNLDADDYEFKVVKVHGLDTTWYGVKIEEGQTWEPMTYENSTAWWLNSDPAANNVGLQAKKAGEYEFIFEKNEHNEISVVIPMPDDYAKYYITGNAALVGVDDAWNPAAVRATADTYTFYDLPAGDYQLKVTLDGTWDDPDNNVKGIANLTTRAAGLQDVNGNIGFTLADKGDVTVTFNATKFELEGDFVVTPIVKTFMATTSGWSSDDESSAVYDAVNEKIIVNLVKYKEAQWQAQVHYQGPIAKAGKYYDISLKFLANKNVNGVTLKYQDNGQLLYEEASVNLVADETYVYTKNNLDGVDGGNGIFVFDFGFAAAGTVIEISDIQIVERDAFYTVAGVPSLCGSNWDETDTDNDMVLSEGLYTWTKNDVILRKGNVEFKVVKNHDWNNGANAWPAENYALAIAQDGKYDVVITFNESTQEILATATFKEAVALDHTAVLKGLADNENPWIGEDMEQAQDKLTASITKYFIPSKPEGDTLEFKMVIDDAWRSNGYLYHRGFVGAAGIVGDVTPTDENNGNMKVVVDVEGDYVFTWTFANDSLGIEFPYKAPDVYTVAGSAVLFGVEWDATDTDNDMVLNEGLHTWTKEDVILQTGNIEFKVVMNHDWANAWPAENYVLNIPQDGKYDVLITFNADTKEINASATFKEPVEVDPTAKLMGIPDWNGADMDLALDKLSASVTMHLTPSDADGDTLTFKMKINGGWRSNGYLYHRGFVGATDIVDNVDDNMLVVVDIAGDYTFTWTFADNALEITFPAKPEPVLANGYYLIGKTGWDEEALSADLKFAANPDADGEFMLTIALAVSDYIKVVFVEDDAIQTWYPDGLGNEYIVDANHAGAAKTIYFKPGYDENWAAFGGYIWIDANSPATGINNTDANAKVEKVLENGQVFIIKNGQIFNVTGQLVK